MDTKVMTRERISALADGELISDEVTLALAALRSPEERDTWDVYHQIGDVLRSDDMGMTLSPGFSSKMAALLEAEPTIVAPQPKVEPAHQVLEQAANGDVKASRNRAGRRFMLPGAAVAAAVIAAVYVAMPQQAVVTADSNAGNAGPQMSMAAVNVPSAMSTVSATSTQVDQAGGQSVAQFSALAQQGEVKRDPRIDEYLFAHQRFSPSMYSSAQYARSAAFSVSADNK